MTLFEITGELQELWEMLESGEYDEDMLIDTMEAVEGDFAVKAEGYVKIIKQMETDAAGMAAMAAEFTKKKQTLENGIKNLKNRLLYLMEAGNVPEVKGEHFRIKPVNNGGAKPLILTDMNPDEYPVEFQKQIIEVDKDKIRKALDAGEQLSFAHYGERGRHLSIK